MYVHRLHYALRDCCQFDQTAIRWLDFNDKSAGRSLSTGMATAHDEYHCEGAT